MYALLPGKQHIQFFACLTQTNLCWGNLAWLRFGVILMVESFAVKSEKDSPDKTETAAGDARQRLSSQFVSPDAVSANNKATATADGAAQKNDKISTGADGVVQKNDKTATGVDGAAQKNDKSVAGAAGSEGTAPKIDNATSSDSGKKTDTAVKTDAAPVAPAIPKKDAPSPKPVFEEEKHPSGTTAPQNKQELIAAERKYFDFEFHNKNVTLDPFQKGEGPYQVLERMNQEHKLTLAAPFVGVRRDAWSEEQILEAASKISQRDLHGSKHAYKVGEQTPLWSETDIKKRVDDMVKLPRGIDVSHFDNDIDWTKVKDSGLDFAFIKATGAKRSGAVDVDPKFAQNEQGARDAGLKIGFYHYFRADVPVDKQVEQFTQAVGKQQAKDLPLVMDAEEDDVKPNWTTAPDGHAYTSQERVKMITDFCDGVKKILGPDTRLAIYTSSSFVNTYLGNDKAIAKYPLWDANWKVAEPAIPQPFTKPAFWQYAGDTGKVAGITKAPGAGVDLDIAMDPHVLEDHPARKHQHRH